MPELKPTKRYLLCRVYAGAAGIVWFVSIPTWCYRMLTSGDTYGGLFLLPLVAIGLPALCMVFNWMVFPSPYSVFGPYRRSVPPEELPVVVVGSSFGRFGNLTATKPMVTWRVYRSGLEIAIELIGRAFLPTGSIVAVRRGWWGNTIVHHVSPEIRSPITMPGAVYEALVTR